MAVNNIKNVNTPMRTPREGDLLLLGGGRFYVLLNDKLHDEYGMTPTLTNNEIIYGYVIPDMVANDPSTQEYKIKQRILNAVAKRKQILSAKKKELDKGNKPGHGYATRDGDCYLLLGNGVVTKLMGNNTLASRKGYVYLRIAHTFARHDTRAAKVNFTKQMFYSNLLVTPGNIKFNEKGNFGYFDTRWQILVTKNPKEGFDAGKLMDIDDDLTLTVGDDSDGYGDKPNGWGGRITNSEEPMFLFINGK